MTRRKRGTGSVFPRASDGAWIAQVSTGPRGHRVVHSRSAPTKRQALAKLARLRSELDVEVVSGSEIAVGVYLERWAHEVRNIRPTTRRGYLAVVSTHLAPAIGDIALRALTPVDVEAALAAMEPAMSAKTLRNIHAVLRRALGQAVRSGLVTRNVAAREFIDTPRVPTVEPRSLTEVDARRLLAAARGDRLEALFITALGTGLRQGELLGLAWEDIGPVHLTVRKELVYRDGKYDRGEPKTERSKRQVPLSPGVRRALTAHEVRMKAEGWVTALDGPVFVSRRGTALSGSWVTHHFYELLAAAGVARIPFKNLRTTFASRLFAAGVPDPTVAALLGHARTTTTRRHYIAVEPASMVEAVERLVGESVTESVTARGQRVG